MTTTSAGITPVITLAGAAAVRAAQGNGLQATISQVAVGRGVPNGSGFTGYAPVNTQTALNGQMALCPILSGTLLGNGSDANPLGFQVEALLGAAGGNSFPINELGFLLSDGTLFAVWSDPAGPVAYATPYADVELAFDLFITTVPVTALTINVLNVQYPDLYAPLASLLRAVAVNTTLELKTRERLARRGII